VQEPALAAVSAKLGTAQRTCGTSTGQGHDTRAAGTGPGPGSADDGTSAITCVLRRRKRRAWWHTLRAMVSLSVPNSCRDIPSRSPVAGRSQNEAGTASASRSVQVGERFSTPTGPARRRVAAVTDACSISSTGSCLVLVPLSEPTVDVLEERVRNHADHGRLLLEALQRRLGSGHAGLGLLVLLQLREGELRALLPVAVEAALELRAQVVRPDGAEAAHTAWRLAVRDDADNSHGRRLQDRDGLDDLLLVHLRAGALDVADDVRHARLERHEGRQVRLLRRVVLRERSHAPADLLRALARQEAEMAVTRVFELGVGHFG